MARVALRLCVHAAVIDNDLKSEINQPVWIASRLSIYAYIILCKFISII